MSESQTAIKKQVKVLEDGRVTTPKGFHARGIHFGLKRKRKDLGWLYSEVPADSAAVYTTNTYQAAPLVVTRESVSVENKIQGILVNSGNANACTGEKGLQDAYQMRKEFAAHAGIQEHLAAVVSTGVIGQHLPMEKILNGIAALVDYEVDGNADDFEEAILTTDTCVKHIGVELEIDEKKVMIGGAAKGSGMIHPNMATMLGFITTDAAIDHNDLSEALKQVTNSTFNMITVDGDTSTNDMVMVLANGLAENKKLTKQHKDWGLFLEGLEMVSKELAKKIARDGEGATKLIEVQVKDARDKEAAGVIAKKIVGSSLVKTAVFGADANWGRIICAVGYSGQQIDPNLVSISLGSIKVVENGLPVPFDEDDAYNYLMNDTIKITVDLAQGNESAVAWGCDLSYDYVRINASYRT
ncbi:bifunctional ornithine acetyltransferase/N-acetylglutamate synthase [Pseudalkalibacillus caeni]|uniref:Arginine biosynthesis bifunctional protein ArgJ n=1 Tax=Exobacillus caeni TaxID=2574798 RepID=A0A5R9EZT6_9BACL|nr:bifunctional ornithine acetyltransferase/N-acetylglutamate synthase [Pseudalkalibacillus caeni]TLS36862.1 bifunctional ornithine acetyltransferase/N-acetylglutamate synthase [Pseudalkalibacillus caeni]